jgi:methyl-accepting chemotaxis protein
MRVIAKSFKILAPGNSLQRRTGYSLALVRLILAPVIFLAIYYLFRMGWIVDRIVNVDAPASALAQQASIEMLEARRAERNFLLLHDATDLAANHDAVGKTEQTLEDIQNLESNDMETVERASQALALYRQQFAEAVVAVDRPGQTSTDRIQTVVRDYERDLNNLLQRSRHVSREHLMEELRQRVNSFEDQISKTTEETNPDLQRLTEDLQNSSDQVLGQSAQLEAVNWTRVKSDHAQARNLLHEAEWALSVVSVLTLLISIWVSYILPRQVVKPLLSLKEAIDHAAGGNYEIEFDVQGKGEIVDLVDSLRRMLDSLRMKTQPEKISSSS